MIALFTIESDVYAFGLTVLEVNLISVMRFFFNKKEIFLQIASWLFGPRIV